MQLDEWVMIGGFREFSQVGKI